MLLTVTPNRPLTPSSPPPAVTPLILSLPCWVPVGLAVIGIRRLWLPLPLVLLWPLMAVAWLLALAAVFGWIAVRRPALARRPWRLVGWTWCLLGALRGLYVDVDVRSASRRGHPPHRITATHEPAVAEEPAPRSDSGPRPAGGPAPLRLRVWVV